MLRLAKRGLILVAIVGIVFLAGVIGLTAQKGTAIETVSDNQSTKAGSATVSKVNRSSIQDIRQADEKKYKLIVRVKSPTSDPQSIPHLIATVRNESQEVIYVVDTGNAWDFEFEIKDKSGKTVPQKDDLRIRLREAAKQSVEPIPAGQEVSYVVNLGELYTLASGEYLVTVKKAILLSDKQTFVSIKSAPVKFAYEAPK